MSNQSMAILQQEPKRSVGYVVEFVDTQGTSVVVSFQESGYAENVLRALVHSGYKATIEEKVINIPAALTAINDFRYAEHSGRKERDRDHVVDYPTAACEAPRPRYND